MENDKCALVFFKIESGAFQRALMLGCMAGQLRTTYLQFKISCMKVSKAGQSSGVVFLWPTGTSSLPSKT